MAERFDLVIGKMRQGTETTAPMSHSREDEFFLHSFG